MAAEWFYHAAMSSAEQIEQQTRVQMSLVYFRALWWFGWLASTPLCTRVPKEAADLVKDRSNLDLRWARALGQVESGYPHTWRKTESLPDDWQRATNGLLALRRDMPRPVPGPAGRPTAELHMYINGFLADCARYNPAGLKQDAREFLAEARRCGHLALDHDPDSTWNFAWLELFDAEIGVERHEPAEAIRAMDAIMGYDEDCIDADLQCRFMMAAARLARDGGDLASAASFGANAVLRTYIYHVKQETVQQAPSQYTMNLHEESLHHFAATLELAKRDPETWVETATRVVEYFTPYWHDSLAADRADEDGADGFGAEAPALPDAAELAELSIPELLVRYVPQPPTPADLVRVTGRYAQRAEHVREMVGQELEWPPAGGWRPVEAAIGTAEATTRAMQDADAGPEADGAAVDDVERPAPADEEADAAWQAGSARRPGWLRRALRGLVHAGFQPQPRQRRRRH